MMRKSTMSASPWQGEAGAKRREGVGPRTRRSGLKTGLARRLRREMTIAEGRLWHILRRRNMLGLRFRRQHPFGAYVLDFYCPQLALAIEVDGNQHGFATRRAHDARRDAILRRKGITILRYDNADVLKNMDSVLEDIRLTAQRLLCGPTPTPALPLPGGGGMECAGDGGSFDFAGRADR